MDKATGNSEDKFFQNNLRIENFLLELIRTTRFLKPEGFVNALSELEREGDISMIMGNKTPKEVLKTMDIEEGEGWKKNVGELKVIKPPKSQGWFSFCLPNKLERKSQSDDFPDDASSISLSSLKNPLMI